MRKNEVNMTDGPLFLNILRFSVPILLSSILQMSFSTADLAVVGRLCNSNALASIGATTSLTNLMLNLFMGMASGATIAVSFSLGKKNEKDISEHIHNAMAVAFISGALVAILAFIVARPALSAMGVEGDILNGAVKYFTIYFAGAPFSLVYNYGASIINAHGDSKSPFKFLAISGALNLALNIFFVWAFDMDIAGVALATVISNGVSSVLVIRSLMKNEGCSRLYLKKIKIYKKRLFTIMKFGIPAGIQSCMFSIPNVLIQTSINSFGPAAITGNTAAVSAGAYYEMGHGALGQCAMTFISRNYGAGNYKRIKKILFRCLLVVIGISGTLGWTTYFLSDYVLAIFIKDNPAAMEVGKLRLFYLALPNMIGAAHSVYASSVRGLGKSIYPMVTNILGVCVFRIVWLATVFPIYHTLDCVYITYPITWAIALVALVIYFHHCYRHIVSGDFKTTTQ